MEDISRPLRERAVAFENVDDDVARGPSSTKNRPPQHAGQTGASSRNPVEILVERNRKRAPGLVPLRFARMLTDPLSFCRGSAALMAVER